MGLFTKIGQKLDSIWGKIVALTKKLINFMSTALKKSCYADGKVFYYTHSVDRQSNELCRGYI